MGTVMNGKKWAGACVNGKTVSGLVKNGVVFYKKSSISYKRRIMIGDNLSGKTIFQDFPDGFFLVDFSWDTSRVLINSNDIDIYEKLDSMGFYEIYCGGDSNLMYRCDVTGAMPTTKKDVKLGSYSNAIVTEVNENEAYRHIFIEDENIRPVQVGDVITRNTRFYFTIPDDIFSKTNIGTNPIRLDNGSTLSVLSHSSPKRIRFYANNAISPANDVVVYENDKITTNKSSMIVSPVSGNYFEGTVSRVESNSLVYNMTFVDVRTLG